MNKEIQKKLDEWYTEYCRTNGRFPTCAELVEKINELENSLNTK